MPMPADPILDEHDPLSFSELDSSDNNLTTPFFRNFANRFSIFSMVNTLPTTFSPNFCWPVQTTAHTLMFATNPNNPQTVILTDNWDTTQHLTATNQLHLSNFNLTSAQSDSNSSLIHLSFFAYSSTKHTSCTTSYTLLLTIPLLASSLSSFPSRQSMTTTDSHSPTLRTPNHQRLSPHQTRPFSYSTI